MSTKPDKPIIHAKAAEAEFNSFLLMENDYEAAKTLTSKVKTNWFYDKENSNQFYKIFKAVKDGKTPIEILNPAEYSQFTSSALSCNLDILINKIKTAYFLRQALEHSDDLRNVGDISVFRKNMEFLEKEIFQDSNEAELPIIQAGEWLGLEIEPPVQIIPNLFNKGDKGDLSSGPKGKKSWYALQMTLCIATGRPFLNFERPDGKKIVLYVNCEIQPYYFQKRVKLQCKGLNITPDELKDTFYVCNSRGLQFDLKAIEKLAKKINPDLIVLDPWYKFVEGDENGIENIKPLLLELDRIITGTGCSILKVLHHSKGYASDKQTIDRPNGSGVIGRDFDVSFDLSPHAEGDNLKILEITNRNFPDKNPITLFFDTNTLVFHPDARRPIHKTRTNSKTNAPDNPTDEQLKNILKEPIGKTEFIQKLNNGGIPRTKARAYCDELVRTGTLEIWERPDKNNIQQIGFPTDIERLKMEAKTT